MTTSPDQLATTKAELRKQVLARRDALSPTARAGLSQRISARILALGHFRAARSVLAYASFGSEFDTRALIDDVLARGKALLLPRVDRGPRRLCLHRITDLERDLIPGTWGILEPRPTCPQARLADADWVLMPGVAFTMRCERLGYGAGFYDRLIAEGESDQAARPTLVAAAFDTQMVAQLPMSSTDRCADLVVTETAVYTRPADDES